LLSLYLGITAGTGHRLLGLLAALGGVALGLPLGPRKSFAFLALTDLTLILPVQLLVLWAQNTAAPIPFGAPDWRALWTALGWRLCCYILALDLGIILWRNTHIRDGWLPTRGPWTRKLLALTAVSLAALAIIGSVLWSLSTLNPWEEAPRWTALLPALLFPYFRPAWDVLARGWDPR
jgi:hypothetical protein